MGAFGPVTPPRIVLDTSVLLSALVFPAGTVAWIRAAWRAAHIRPLVSRDTMAEFLRVLSYPKFRLTAVEREDLIDEYLPCCETVVIPDPPPWVPVCRDPFDRPFLELALAGRADALVTGDRDLLALVDTFTIPILTPAALRERLPDTVGVGASRFTGRGP